MRRNVDASVTHIKEGTEGTGYQSGRVKADGYLIAWAERFYRDVSQGMPLWRRVRNLFGFKLTGKLAAGLAGGVLVSRLTAHLWRKAAAMARELFHNDIALQVYTGRCDELGQLLAGLVRLFAVH